MHLIYAITTHLPCHLFGTVELEKLTTVMHHSVLFFFFFANEDCIIYSICAGAGKTLLPAVF